MSYEVYVVYAGALEQSAQFAGEPEAVEWMEIRRVELIVHGEAGLDWEIHLLPHYCDPDDPDCDDSECMCAQWLTDHRPVFSSSS